MSGPRTGSADPVLFRAAPVRKRSNSRSNPTDKRSHAARKPSNKLATLAIAVAFVSISATGCSKPARGIDLIDLNYRRIHDDEKLLRHLDVQRGYWWTENDRVHIALTSNRKGLTKLDDMRFDLSLVLEGLPASDSRTYTFQRDALRAYLHHGLSHERFRSMRGIANVRIEGDRRLSGKFRLSAVKEFFHILTNWKPTGPVVILGEFEAVKNAKSGKEILKRSEEDGMERGQFLNIPVQKRPKPVRVVGPDPMKPAS